MNRDDIIRMAQEAGMREGESGDWTAADATLTYPECVYTENLERFANLVEAAVLERILDMCKEGLWDGEGIKFHLEKRGAPALERMNKAAEDNGEPL